MRGIITSIRLDRGYGFLRGTEDGLDRFFKRTNIASNSPVSFDDLEEGLEVSFEPYTLPQRATDGGPEPKPGNNNLRARQVRVIA
jgi:hypothetical protein